MELIQTKPLSENKFLAFFQRIYRAWLGKWYAFSDKHPKLSKLIYQIAFFFIFSMAVTVWQWLIMLFLPYAFEGIWNQPFCWPRVSLGLTDAAGNALYFGIFNEPVQILKDGVLTQAYTAEEAAALIDAGGVVKVGGLGNFIAFEIAVFTAQCINFPLQRNITYKSKGNPYFQAFMYFVGWVGISILTNAAWGIVNPLVLYWGINDVLISLLKTFITGGVSMFVFFFIFLLIFPNLESLAKKAEKKDAKITASNASEEKKAKAHQDALIAREKANYEKARLDVIQFSSLFEGKAIAYNSYVKKINECKDENELASLNELAKARYDQAMEVKAKLDKATMDFEALKK